MFEYIELEMRHCENEIKRMQKELSKLPKGYLVKKGKTYRYRNEGTEKGITRNKALIRSLIRKKYLQQRMKCLSHNLSIIQRCLEKCRPDAPSDIISSLPNSYKSLPLDYYLYYDEMLSYKKNPYFPEGLNMISNRGLTVRSKSELIIANTLDSRQINYQYEAPLKIGGQIKFPDFTLRRPSDGAIIVWEHLGMIGNDQYDARTERTRNFYENNGFIQFENLFYSYEEDVMDSKRLHNLIDMILLR